MPPMPDLDRLAAAVRSAPGLLGKRDIKLVQRLNGEAAAGGPSHLFRLDVGEASFVGLNEAKDKIVVEIWRPGKPIRRIERA